MALPTGQFKLVVHSWKDSASGQVLIGRNKAAENVRDDFPQIVCGDEDLLKDLLISAAVKSGRLKENSWRLEGTFSKTGERPQPVTSDWEKAQQMLIDAIAQEAGENAVPSQHLLPLPLARDALAVKKDLENNGWTLSGMRDHCQQTGHQEGIHPIKLSEAIRKFDEWELSMVNNGKASIHSYKNHRYRLVYVDRFFPGVHLQHIMSRERQRTFISGSAPIPLPDPSTLSPRQLLFGRTNIGKVRRPWNYPSQLSMSTAISALAHWGADETLHPEHGIYVTRHQAESVWFPINKKAKARGEQPGEGYFKSAKTATPYEYRSWLNYGFQKRFAARIVFEGWFALRPDEVSNPGDPANNIEPSWYDFNTGIFHVSDCCKTGGREVRGPYNAQLVLEILRQEERYSIDPVEHLSYVHGCMGYAFATPKNDPTYRDRYPEKFHKRQDPQGRAILVPWGHWTPKLPRHTVGSIFYAATGDDCGLTAGYLGHRHSTFMKHYKGKVHAEIYRNHSIYQACKAFYQALPRQLRARGLRERDIPLPTWFVLEDDSNSEVARRDLVNLASKFARKA